MLSPLLFNLCYESLEKVYGYTKGLEGVYIAALQLARPWIAAPFLL